MKSNILATLVFLVVPLSAAAADGLRPGSWRVDSTMEIPNLPSVLTSSSATYCISKEEARDPRRLVFRQKDCIFKAFSKENNRMTWKMNCSGKTNGILTGEGLMGGDTFESTMKLQSGDSVSMLQIHARRLGECPRETSDSVSGQSRQGTGKGQ